MNPPPIPAATTPLNLGTEQPIPKRGKHVHRDAVPTKDLELAQQERDTAFEAEHTWPIWNAALKTWEPVVLHGYSSGREALFYKLRAADGSLPLSRTLEQLTTFLSDAIRILWLCSHDPQDWRALRGDLALFLEAIEAWGDVNVPRSKHVEAVNLALQIYNEAGINQAVPEPSDKEHASGN
jgi:hypothetical protein